jgi:hypothetical protein
MKINKQSKELLESKLVEEETTGALDATDSVGEIADEIVDEIPVSDAAAKTIASEIKDVAADTGIETAAIDIPDELEALGVQNPITEVLDEALAKSRKNKGRGSKSGFNVLIIGLPGSGKTASIEDWARANAVNLVSINAKNNDLDAYINGYTTKRPDDPLKVTQAFSDNLAGLEKKDSVLFLDEYNRQVKPNIRASLYTLINEHKIVGDGPNRQHEFKNMLFTIAAINPSVPTDKGAAPLNDAEKSRFWWIMDDMDSDPATTMEFLTKYYNKEISKLNPESEYYRDDLEEFLRIQDLGLFIVSHPKFDYDTRADLEVLAAEDCTLLCQRALTNGLHNSEGDVRQFVRWVEKGSKFLPRDIDMLTAIAREYIVPSFEALCKGRDLDAATIAGSSATPETDTFDDFAGEEDDDDFFTSSELKGKVRAKNPYEVEVVIADALREW